MSWGLVITAGVGLAGSVYASNKAGKAADRAGAAADRAEDRADRMEVRLNQAIDGLNSLVPPNLQQYVIPFERAVLMGELTPEEATAQLAEQTRMAGISVPPELLSAQQNALRRISEIADEGGLTAIDRARLFDAKEEMATASRGAQEAIMQEAAQRGVSGSGVEMANRMLAQQAAATRGARAGVDTAAEAQRRALEAISQSGQMAGSMRTQSMNEQARVAEAQDAINRFNTEITNRTSAANVAARNNAQEANLRERQRVAEFNIGQREREAATRLGAAQDAWQNTMNLATARTNAAAGQANAALNASSAAANAAATSRQNAAATQAAAFQQAGQSIGKLVDAYNAPKKDGKS